MTPKELAIIAAKALDEKKGKEIAAIEVTEQTTLADYFVIATGSFMWDGTDADGNYVPSGTVAHVQLDAVLPYSHDEAEDGTLFEDAFREKNKSYCRVQ